MTFYLFYVVYVESLLYWTWLLYINSGFSIEIIYHFSCRNKNICLGSPISVSMGNSTYMVAYYMMHAKRIKVHGEVIHILLYKQFKTCLANIYGHVCLFPNRMLHLQYNRVKRFSVIMNMENYHVRNKLSSMHRQCDVNRETFTALIQLLLANVTTNAFIT